MAWTGGAVRVLLCVAEDMDKLREMEMFREDGRDGVWTVMANVMDPESLRRAFDGCAGVFHTSAFVDPGGISGYTVSSTASLFFLLTSISRFFFPRNILAVNLNQ